MRDRAADDFHGRRFLPGSHQHAGRVCEARDPKGEYARARAGILAHFTGVSDPYEPPDDAEIIINTTDTSVERATEIIVQWLQAKGYCSNLKPATY
jgi:adenylylsulfate kinase-like enzyme